MKYKKKQSRHEYSSARHLKMIIFHCVNWVFVPLTVLSAFSIILSSKFSGWLALSFPVAHFTIAFVVLPLVIFKGNDIYKMRALFVERVVKQLHVRLNAQYIEPQSAFWRNRKGLMYALSVHSRYASTLSGIQRRVKHASYRLYETRYVSHFGTSKSMRKVKYYYRPEARDFCLSIFLDHQIVPCDFLLNTRRKEAKAFQNWLDENRPETREDTFEGQREGFLLRGAGPGLDQVDEMLSPEFFEAFKALQKHLLGREPRIIVRRRTDRGRPAQSILILIRAHRTLGAPHICLVKSEEAALKDAQVQIELVEALVEVLRGDVTARVVYASKPSYTPQIPA